MQQGKCENCLWYYDRPRNWSRSSKFIKLFLEKYLIKTKILASYFIKIDSVLLSFQMLQE